jgi:excisionase family DNA binding protein
MQVAEKMTQIDGVSARQIFEAFKTLESKIEDLKTQAPPAPAPGYLSRQEVAKMLNVSLVTLNDWTNKGFLKAYRLGQKVFYKAAEIDAAMVEIKKGGRQHGKG